MFLGMCSTKRKQLARTALLSKLKWGTPKKGGRVRAWEVVSGSGRNGSSNSESKLIPIPEAFHSIFSMFSYFLDLWFSFLHINLINEIQYAFPGRSWEPFRFKIGNTIRVFCSERPSSLSVPTWTSPLMSSSESVLSLGVPVDDGCFGEHRDLPVS